MNPSTDLTVVTTVTGPYVRFLRDWAASLAALTIDPARILVVGNGLGPTDRNTVPALLRSLDCPRTFFDLRWAGCGHARNVAINQVETPWVMHLDADDTLLPDALEQVAAVADDADVVQLPYRQWWPHNSHGYEREVNYKPLNGLEALSADRIASGCSPFRTEFWHRWHYDEHLQASYDYSLWLGFAYLGARFRPTPRPAFLYRQWEGSLWRTVGQHHHDDLLMLRRALEKDFPAVQAANLGRVA